MASFWNESKQTRIPFVEKFNEAIRGSEKVVWLLGTLSFAWLASGAVWVGVGEGVGEWGCGIGGLECAGGGEGVVSCLHYFFFLRGLHFLHLPLLLIDSFRLSILHFSSSFFTFLLFTLLLLLVKLFRVQSLYHLTLSIPPFHTHFPLFIFYHLSLTSFLHRYMAKLGWGI